VLSLFELPKTLPIEVCDFLVIKRPTGERQSASSQNYKACAASGELGRAFRRTRDKRSNAPILLGICLI
jgi:hypothetical protein